MSEAVISRSIVCALQRAVVIVYGFKHELSLAERSYDFIHKEIVFHIFKCRWIKFDRKLTFHNGRIQFPLIERLSGAELRETNKMLFESKYSGIYFQEVGSTTIS